MKAPEKIYIGLVKSKVDNGVVYTTVSEEFPNAKEYIRKNIVDETIATAEDHAYFAGKEKLREELLEWAKETYLNENASAIRKVCYKQLIDKLNSM